MKILNVYDATEKCFSELHALVLMNGNIISEINLINVFWKHKKNKKILLPQTFGSAAAKYPFFLGQFGDAIGVSKIKIWKIWITMFYSE